MVIVILIILSCIALLAWSFIAYMNYAVRSMHTSQTLAENIQISSEPTEITPEKPLKGKKRFQQIALLIDGYRLAITGQDPAIRLTDGTIVDPKIEIVDENDNVRQLEISGRSIGKDMVFVNFSGINELSIPKNIVYKTIRISSARPFRSNIYWKDFDLK